MDNTHHVLFENSSDLRAEFVAASWLDAGLAPEQMLFKALGAFKRRSHADVEATQDQGIGYFKGCVIESNRPGIYDHLPEQLFHLPSSGSGKTLKRKIDEIRLQREKEQNTRLFFLPLEQEFFFSKVLVGQIEQLGSDFHPQSALFQELRNFWQIPPYISDRTFIRLLPLLPAMAEHRADLCMVGLILSNLLGTSVLIETSGENNKTQLQGAEIAVARLGVDLLLGGNVSANLPELLIQIQFGNTVGLEESFLDPHYHDVVHWLLGWMLPVEYDYKILLHVGPAQLHLEMQNELQSRLGFSSFLVGI